MGIEGKEKFDYDAFRQQAIERMLVGDKEITGNNGVLAPMLKDLLHAVLSDSFAPARQLSGRCRKRSFLAIGVNRPAKWGVRDLLITSIDYLKGFGDAIETVFPLLPFILYPFL